MTKTDELRAACAAKGLNYVGTRGVVQSPICFVGEAPGADEDQQGVPFVGSSGRELGRMLTEAGFSGDIGWFTNPYKVRPPDNKLDQLRDFGIPLTLFEEQFFEELHQYKPSLICALGATPLGLLCPFTRNKRTGHGEIGKYLGSLLCSEHLSWPHYVVPAYHPASLFRTWDNRPLDVLVFGRLKEEFDYLRQHGQLQPLPQRKLISDPAADDTIDYLRGLLSSPSDRVVAVDIENIGAYRGKYKTKQRNRIPYVIGLATDPACGISIGLGEYDKIKAFQIWRLLDTVLRTRRQVYQNGYSHDIPWLQYIGFTVNAALCHDTMVRHWTLWPELSHKLEFQTFQYTREPYYKDEGKEWSVKDRQKMKRYNCKDVCVDIEIYYEQEKEFAARA